MGLLPWLRRTSAAALLMLAVLLAAAPASAEDGAPEVAAQPSQVNAGDTFDLEVSVRAHANGTYRVTFDARQYFSFPSSNLQEVRMLPDDTHIFRIACRAAVATPDDEYVMLFNLTWTVNATERKVPGTLTVTVGQGQGDDICTSSVMVAAAAVAAQVAIVRPARRRE